MNISATAAMGYTYTNIKTGVSQKKDVRMRILVRSRRKRNTKMLSKSISRSIRIPHLM